MSYQTMEWFDNASGGTPLSAENLNNMIEGIDEALESANEALAREIDWEDLSSYVQAEINSKMIAVFAVGSTTIFNECTDFNKVYYTTVNGVDYRFYIVLDSSNNKKAQFRESVNGIETRTYNSSNSSWSDWSNICANLLTNTSGSVATSNIADSAVTADKIGASAVTTAKINDTAVSTEKLANGAVSANKIKSNAVETAKIQNNAVTYDKLSEELQAIIDVIPPDDILFRKYLNTISTSGTFNSSAYCLVNCFYQFTADGNFAAEIGVDDGDECEMRYVGGYQVVTKIATQEVILRPVYRVAPTFSAGEWTAT